MSAKLEKELQRDVDYAVGQMLEILELKYSGLCADATNTPDKAVQFEKIREGLVYELENTIRRYLWERM